MGTDSFVVELASPQAQDPAHAGGKGANLAALIAAGLPVPDGFVVTTDAYAQFLATGGLGDRLAEILSSIDWDDADRLESSTASIRELIVEAEMPTALATSISDAYESLGDGAYVAVRSSGTAEDLEQASFAGLHETYLDVSGKPEVVDAVKRCWASMWTARAVSYRRTKDIDQLEARIAVVVQEMVASEVAGVMFTVNPMTEATDELVVNANWGLGESVVSGIANPDYWVLRSSTLEVKEFTLGGKEVRVVRDPHTGRGTAQEEVPQAERETPTLSEHELVTLGDLGRRVMRHYDDLPQDIEWARAGGRFYLLQSRPVTGVAISWDEDVDAWQELPDGDEIVWTRTWADEQWTGAITPLFYSWRADMFTRAYSHCADLWGVPEMKRERMYKFHKAEAYFNSALEKAVIEHTVFPAFRAGPNVLNHVPPTWHEEILRSPFSVLRYLKMHTRITVAGEPANTPYAFLKTFDNYFYNRADEADGLPSEKVRTLSDDALVEYIERCIAFEIEFAEDLWAGYYLYARDAFSLLGWMLANWYDGDNPLAFGELVTGTPKRTATLQENIELLELANEIRRSPSLRELFDRHQDAEFFAALRDTEEGRGFLERYEQFAAKHSHRGHAERDVYFPRRCEDAGIDYRAWKSLLSSEEELDPVANEERINRRREEVIEEVVENIRKRPFGSLRAEVFKLVLDWALKFLVVRDDERYLIDRSTFAAKRGFLELNRRLIERGLVETERDFYFLTRAELYDLFGRRKSTPLIKAKVAGRMRDFDRFLAREANLPIYLQNGRSADLAFAAKHGEDGVFHGIGTSHGVVQGRARVVHSVEEIGRVKKGEILITNHTDPGWTPVFLVIGGIVLETGGMLAHGSLLAREYGFPAVQIPGATTLIPEGALITVDGDTGRVIVDEEHEPPSGEGLQEPATAIEQGTA